MRVETYIPGLTSDSKNIAKHAEDIGYDALVSGELNNEPFLPVLIGLEHTNLIFMILNYFVSKMDLKQFQQILRLFLCILLICLQKMLK